jgi:hypothetical protein
MKPRARREGLIVRQLPDELVVYDLERHQAHRLNRTAALVFDHADGGTTVGAIAGALCRELNVADADRLAWLALDRLDRAHLLDQAPVPPTGLASSGRRDLLRRAGLAAALLPVVSSILAPTAAEAANTCVADCTGQPAGTPCYNNNPADCVATCTCDAFETCDDLVGNPCP